jgi:hypothetical protein
VNRPVVIAAVMLLAGAATGWFARGVADGRGGQAPAPVARTHDDDLREILADPAAHALAAKVTNASRTDDGCELEVDTAIGWFRVACGSGEPPSVGDRRDVFGRVAPTGQVEGVPTLLRPAWLEPAGTIARLRGR